jgi:hypothetical protein
MLIKVRFKENKQKREGQETLVYYVEVKAEIRDSWQKIKELAWNKLQSTTGKKLEVLKKEYVFIR